jgi:HSP20 family protein
MAKDAKGKTPQPENDESPVHVDMGLGLGGLFKGLGNFIELAGKLAEQAEELKGKQGGREFTFKTPGGKEGRGVFGFSVRTLAEGEPVVSTFGNIKKTPKGPVVEEVREPLVDVFDEQGHIRLIAELPGVGEEDVQVELKGDILTLKAEGKEHKYAKEVLLPHAVKEDSLQKSYHNGILEITLQKT